MSDVFTDNYLRANAESSKQISLVVTINGLPFRLSNRPIFSVVRYGDPDIFYGTPGLVYGALRRRDDIQDILSLEGSSLTLSQKLEPEQGKASVSTMSLAFIDKNQLVTQICTPGFYIPEILGASVIVELGYEQVSYPSDYFVIFRGFITSFTQKTGVYTFQLSDPNARKRRLLFVPGSSTLTAPVLAGDTTIPVVSTGQFYQQVLGPDATYDPAITTYGMVDDEFFSYPPTGITPTSFTSVVRGERGTTPANHAIDSTVSAFIQFQDHAIDMALKLMLSGWQGPWISDQPLKSIITTLDGTLGNIQNAIIFPDGVDVLRDYGLVVGDTVTISGAGDPLNDITSTIQSFLDINDFQRNQIILLNDNLNSAEFPTTATVAFRSQFDRYPNNAGLKMTPQEVDVQGHLTLKQQFLADNSNSYRFLMSDQQTGKDFMELEIYLPVACYSVTRRGRVSVKITKPPLAATDLIILNQNNIIEPQNISIVRATNNRKFFNEVNIQYDVDDAGNFLSIFDVLDDESLSLVGLSSVLPITSLGSKSDLAINIQANLSQRARFLLSRYKRGALIVSLKVNYGTGNLIEAGDIVGLDGTDLELPNFDTGDRDFGVQLFEVQNRTLDIRSGNVGLELISGVGASATDRFGSVSPSSVLDTGSTTSQLVIKDSYSAANPIFPHNEPLKWRNYIGQTLFIHDAAFTTTMECVLTSFDPVNPYKLNVSGLSSPPPAGYIVDIPYYPTDTNPVTDSIYKAIHGHLSPQVTVVSGIDDFNFTVGSGDIGKFFVGGMVRVHNYSYGIDSGDNTITAVDTGTNTITVKNSLGFTPAAGQFIDLIGFPDHGGAYRWI